MSLHDLLSARAGEYCEGMFDRAVAESCVGTGLDVAGESLAHVLLACFGHLGVLDLSLSFDLMSKLALLLIVHGTIFQASLVHRVVLHNQMLHRRFDSVAVKKMLEGTDSFLVHAIQKRHGSSS